MTKSIQKKFKAFCDDQKAQMGGVGTMYAVFFASIIVLAIVIVFTFVPGIGATVSTSVPAAPANGAGSEWNTTNVSNPNYAALQSASGVGIWTSASGMLKVALIIGVVVIILGSLFAIFQHRQQPPGGAGGGGGM